MCSDGIAVHEQVVLHDAIPPAADKRGSRHSIEQVAGDFRAAEHVVQIDAHAAASSKAVDVVQVVVADDRAAHGPVAAGVDRSRVVRFVAHAVDLVELDQVIVAAEAHAHVRRVVDQVVRGSIADALQRECPAGRRASRGRSDGCGCSRRNVRPGSAWSGRLRASEMPPPPIWYMSQPTTPCPRPPDTVTAQPPTLRIVQPTTRFSVPPDMVIAVPRAPSIVNPRSVTCDTSFIVTMVGSTDTIASPCSTGDGGQK